MLTVWDWQKKAKGAEIKVNFLKTEYYFLEYIICFAGIWNYIGIGTICS